MTAFFVPDVPSGTTAEGEYARILREAEADSGQVAREVRIFKLSFRLRGTDYEAEVGRPDPIEGRTVLAILDLGRDAPYLIHCRPNGGLAQQVVVRKPVYSVTEFSK